MNLVTRRAKNTPLTRASLSAEGLEGPASSPRTYSRVTSLNSMLARWYYRYTGHIEVLTYSTLCYMTRFTFISAHLELLTPCLSDQRTCYGAIYESK